MSRGSRVVLILALLLFSWMALSGWATDPPRVRLFSAVFAAFMLMLAAGIAAPTRLRVLFRIVAGTVALVYGWYVVVEVRALLGGEAQNIRLGSPSAVMAGLGFLVFGVPALVYALGGVTTGWVDRAFRRMRNEPPSD